MNIPKIMVHIWIGPKNPPLQWMNSWKEKHPDWNYRIFDNAELEKTEFKNQHLIDHYLKIGQYAGVADLIRYEMLLKDGGFFPPADALCLHNTDELWNKPEEWCYTVYEQEQVRKGFVSPIYACNPRNEFVQGLVDHLHTLKVEDLLLPFESTGNKFLMHYMNTHDSSKVHVFPSYYFIPEHFAFPTLKYKGTDKVYANQMWGTSTNSY